MKLYTALFSALTMTVTLGAYAMQQQYDVSDQVRKKRIFEFVLNSGNSTALTILLPALHPHSAEYQQVEQKIQEIEHQQEQEKLAEHSAKKQALENQNSAENNAKSVLTPAQRAEQRKKNLKRL